MEGTCPQANQRLTAATCDLAYSVSLILLPMFLLMVRTGRVYVNDVGRDHGLDLTRLLHMSGHKSHHRLYQLILWNTDGIA